MAYYTDKDFIQFYWTPDGGSQVNLTDLNIYRVSDGNMYNDIASMQFQDTVIPVPGGDGSYYFDTKYTQRNIQIKFAFDKLDEVGLTKLKKTFAAKITGKLRFAETPYKTYMCKLAQPIQLNYVPFDDKDEYDSDHMPTSDTQSFYYMQKSLYGQTEYIGTNPVQTVSSLYSTLKIDEVFPGRWGWAPQDDEHHLRRIAINSQDDSGRVYDYIGSWLFYCSRSESGPWRYGHMRKITENDDNPEHTRKLTAIYDGYWYYITGGDATPWENWADTTLQSHAGTWGVWIQDNTSWSTSLAALHYVTKKDIFANNRVGYYPKRLYKGEGTLNFVSYKPYALGLTRTSTNTTSSTVSTIYSFLNQRYKVLDEYSNTNKPEWQLSSSMPASTSILSPMSATGSIPCLYNINTFSVPVGSALSGISLYNAGDTDVPLKIYISPTVTQTAIYKIALIKYSDFVASSIPTDDKIISYIEFSAPDLSQKPSAGVWLCIDTSTHLIQWNNRNGVPFDKKLYNQNIIGGDFFTLPPANHAFDEQHEGIYVLRALYKSSSSAANYSIGTYLCHAAYEYRYI